MAKKKTVRKRHLLGDSSRRQRYENPAAAISACRKQLDVSASALNLYTCALTRQGIIEKSPDRNERNWAENARRLASKFSGLSGYAKRRKNKKR